ncbi:hypothetical protein GCM10028783_33940 [Modestobacter muralis]
MTGSIIEVEPAPGGGVPGWPGAADAVPARAGAHRVRTRKAPPAARRRNDVGDDTVTLSEIVQLLCAEACTPVRSAVNQ